MVLVSIVAIIIGIILIVAPRYLTTSGQIATYIKNGAFLIGLILLIYGVGSIITEIYNSIIT